MQSECELIQEDVRKVLGTKNAVAALKSYGSGGRLPVEQQLARWQKQLGLN
jgi:argininosuccinate lyase